MRRNMWYEVWPLYIDYAFCIILQEEDEEEEENPSIQVFQPPAAEESVGLPDDEVSALRHYVLIFLLSRCQ